MKSLSSATLLLGDLIFFGGGDLFLFLTNSTKRELLKITPKKISVYVKYQLFSLGGNKESNMTQVTPRKALIRGVVRTGSPLPRSMEVVWKHTITFTLQAEVSLDLEWLLA